ncbi:MAG: hypothetical protein ACR2QK_00055 [Acidimicrobiales bacterium]
MTPSGVAMAADSVITVQTRTTSAHYQSAEKLFRFSSRNPIGLMIHGSPSLLGIPWAPLIKQYRRLNIDPAPTLRDEAKSFLGYASSEIVKAAARGSTGLEAMKGEWLRQSVTAMSDRMKSEAVEASANAAGDPTTAMQLALAKIANLQPPEREPLTSAELDAETALLTDSDAADWARRTMERIARVLRVDPRVIPFWAELQQIWEPTLQAMMANLGRTPSRTGLVLAGYPGDSLLPELLAIDVDGMVGDTIRASVRYERALHIGRLAAEARAFGDVGPILTQLDGVSPDRQRQDVGTVERLIEEVGDDSPEMVASLNNVLKYLHTYPRSRRESYLAALEIMPLAEMASTAERLVGIARLHASARLEPRTVGGPIDVAVISRTDGFAWTERKLYWPAGLNPHLLGPPGPSYTAR